MKLRAQTWSWFVASALAVALGGCGGAATSDASTLSGSVTARSGLAVLVSLEDSSPKPSIVQTTPDRNGGYSFDVSGLQPPYLLMAEVLTGSGSTQLYAVAKGSGKTDVTPDTNQEYESSHTHGGKGDGSFQSLQGLLTQLSTVLAPLFAEFNVTFPLSATDPAALQTLLEAVQLSVSKGTVTVTNRATNGIIFTGKLSNLSSGTFDPANLPPPPGATACVYAYSAWSACQADGTQSRTVVSASPAGCSGTPVLTQSCTSTPQACTYTYSAWSACQPDGTQTRSVVSATPAGCTGTPMLTQACTYTAPTCTYTYSAWGACQPDGTQSRTVISAAPAGCTGTPRLSQSCTYSAPNPVTFSMVVSACTSCHGLTSNTTVFKSGGYTVTGRTAANWLTTVHNMVALGTRLPAGTTEQNFADYLANVP